MMMRRAQILHQHARRILAHSNRTCLFRRSYSTLGSQIKTDLEQLVKQGNQVMPSYVRGFIKNLHDTKHSSQALEASEWMCQQRVFSIFSEDYAARLHLVETVLGLEEAEKFFKSIPENMRDYSVYNTLLGCYTRSEKTLDKAESTFEKMRDLGFLLKPSPYNSMISLYEQLKKQDMIEKLQRELKENNMKEMEKPKTSTVDEKEKKPEKDMPFPSGIVILPIREANRLWNAYKNEGKLKDNRYRSVISYLLKMNNVQEAEKKYGEWYPNGPKLDMSIPDLLISRFRSEGNESKVEEMVKSISTKRILMQFKTVGVCLGLLMLTIVLVAVAALIYTPFVAAIVWLNVWLMKLHPMIPFIFCVKVILENPIIFISICLYLLSQA